MIAGVGAGALSTLGIGVLSKLVKDCSTCGAN